MSSSLDNLLLRGDEPMVAVRNQDMKLILGIRILNFCFQNILRLLETTKYSEV